MPRFHCLLCDTCFDSPANHFCARECQPASGQHADFCRACKAASLKAFESQVGESTVLERRNDRTSR
jgi:hypothetical protein